MGEAAPEAVSATSEGTTPHRELRCCVLVSALDPRLNVLRDATPSGWWGVSYQAGSPRNSWVVNFVNSFEHNPGRYGDLAAAVVELVRRYTHSFSRRLFSHAKVCLVAVEQEMARVPYRELAMDLDRGYAAHAAQCLCDPMHIAKLSAGREVHFARAIREPPLPPAHGATATAPPPNGAVGLTRSIQRGAAPPHRAAACMSSAMPPQELQCRTRHSPEPAALVQAATPNSGTPSGRRPRSPDRPRPGAAGAGGPSHLMAHHKSKRSRIGPHYQATSIPQWTEPAGLVPDDRLDAIPRCRCLPGTVPAVRRFGRWWCSAMDEDGEGGCGFELRLPPLPQPATACADTSAPACKCGRQASWGHGFLWCDAGMCDFMQRPLVPRVEPEPLLIAGRACDLEAARSTAALLTACSYGPVEPFCFISPRSDCGLGLFARVPLRTGQFIAEYGGPRIPARLQKTGQYVATSRTPHTWPAPHPLRPVRF